MADKIQIVSGSLDYYEQMIEIYNEGFISKFRFVTKNETLQRSFAHDFGLVNTKSDDEEYVAVDENRVLGVLSIKYYKASREKYHTNMEHKDLLSKYGVWTAIRAMMLDAIVTYLPPTGELYIDNISVATSARGQGIGTILLNFAIDFAREKGYKQVSLQVMHENPRAKALYERVGFVVKSYRSAKWLKKTTGYSGAYFMVLEL